ncbi:hypothetical protein KACHI17_22770 [Sediminibacterium sp. KACHI17]|uniref:YcxB-like protein domain-containing protein n=1 Tax=Sediminibacterium sp. KACHI17 TaxID=1751071 RepID=A0AAT9GLB8_9BACT
MPEPKSYTAYYKPVPLGFWFYFWIIIVPIAAGLNVFRMVFPFEGDEDFFSRWVFTSAQLIILYGFLERLYQQYKNSKINNCFIKVDDEGISWRLPKPAMGAKEREIIVWSDIKKIVVDEKKVTVKYMSTYFSDTIPFETIIEEDKALLIEALNDQIQFRSIPYENRMAA